MFLLVWQLKSKPLVSAAYPDQVGPVLGVIVRQSTRIPRVTGYQELLMRPYMRTPVPNCGDRHFLKKRFKLHKVTKVTLPDGAVFCNDGHDVKEAGKAARKYLINNNISFDQRPLTVFTFLEMDDTEYGSLIGTQEATDFWDGVKSA